MLAESEGDALWAEFILLTDCGCEPIATSCTGQIQTKPDFRMGRILDMHGLQLAGLGSCGVLLLRWLIQVPGAYI